MIFKKLLAIHITQDYHITIISISFCLVSRLSLCSFLFFLHQRSSVFACYFPSPCLCLASQSHFLSSAIHPGVYSRRKTQGCLESWLLSVSCHICFSFSSSVTCFPFGGNFRFSFLFWNLIVQIWPVSYCTA